MLVYCSTESLGNAAASMVERFKDQRKGIPKYIEPEHFAALETCGEKVCFTLCVFVFVCVPAAKLCFCGVYVNASD